MTKKRETDATFLEYHAWDAVWSWSPTIAEILDNPDAPQGRAVSLARAAGLDPVDLLQRAVVAEAVRRVLASVKRRSTRDLQRENLILDVWHAGMMVRAMRERSWTCATRAALIAAAEEDVGRQLARYPDFAIAWEKHPSRAAAWARSPEGRARIKESLAKVFASPDGRAVLASVIEASEGKAYDPLPITLRLFPREDALLLGASTFASVAREARRILAREHRLKAKVYALVDAWKVAANPDR